MQMNKIKKQINQIRYNQKIEDTLQFCKASTPFEVEEREKMGRRNFFIIVLSCHGCLHVPPHHVEGDTSSNTALEGYQRPLEEVAHAIQRAFALHVPTTFFF
jgi:hypothetical protein